jgi:hypothetical protein
MYPLFFVLHRLNMIVVFSLVPPVSTGAAGGAVVVTSIRTKQRRSFILVVENETKVIFSISGCLCHETRKKQAS